MIRRLIILLLIVGCDESNLLTEHTHTDTMATITDTLYVYGDTLYVIDTLIITNKHGCLDSQATNYDSTAYIDNNSCTYIDSCGVIDIDKANDCVQDCIGVWGGYENDTDGDGICDLWETVTDIDGNTYRTVLIGNQLWMKENLKTTHYRNGDEIPSSYFIEEWIELQTGAFSIYPLNNDQYPLSESQIALCGDDCSNVYGNLYNSYSAFDDRGLCPENWHVPSDEEWTQLISFLDPDADPQAWSCELPECNTQSYIAGGMIKECTYGSCPDSEYWYGNTGTTNESGFTALPAGLRRNDGAFINMGSMVIFMSSTKYSHDSIMSRNLFSNSKIDRGRTWLYYGISVRCLKD